MCWSYPQGVNISVDLPVALDAVSKQNAAWTDNTTDEQQGLTLVANGESIPVEITLPTASVEQPVPVEADLASDLPLMEPESSPIASVQAAVGRSLNWMCSRLPLENCRRLLHNYNRN